MVVLYEDINRHKWKKILNCRIVTNTLQIIGIVPALSVRTNAPVHVGRQDYLHSALLFEYFTRHRIKIPNRKIIQNYLNKIPKAVSRYGFLPYIVNRTFHMPRMRPRELMAGAV